MYKPLGFNWGVFVCINEPTAWCTNFLLIRFSNITVNIYNNIKVILW